MFHLILSFQVLEMLNNMNAFLSQMLSFNCLIVESLEI